MKEYQAQADLAKRVEKDKMASSTAQPLQAKNTAVTEIEGTHGPTVITGDGATDTEANTDLGALVHSTPQHPVHASGRSFETDLSAVEDTHEQLQSDADHDHYVAVSKRELEAMMERSQVALRQLREADIRQKESDAKIVRLNELLDAELARDVDQRAAMERAWSEKLDREKRELMREHDEALRRMSRKFTVINGSKFLDLEPRGRNASRTIYRIPTDLTSGNVPEIDTDGLNGVENQVPIDHSKNLGTTTGESNTKGHPGIQRQSREKRAANETGTVNGLMNQSVGQLDVSAFIGAITESLTKQSIQMMQAAAGSAQERHGDSASKAKPQKVTPRTYYGLESERVTQWTLMFERACTMNGWTGHMMVDVLPMHLAGVALSFYENESLRDPTRRSWEEWRRKLHDRFENKFKASQARERLATTRLETYMSVDEYVALIESTAHDYDAGLSEKSIVGYMLTGLRETEFSAYEKLASSQTEIRTVNEFTSALKNVTRLRQTAQRRDSKTSSSHHPTGSKDGQAVDRASGPKHLEAAMRHGGFGGKPDGNKQQERRYASFICQKCGRPGHCYELCWEVVGFPKDNRQQRDGTGQNGKPGSGLASSTGAGGNGPASAANGTRP